MTVLFCDLAGYTRLTHEIGAEAMHAVTDRFFALADGLVERFGGSVDKHMGDCVMAVFGVPIAHGNDPERAVRAALAIRDAMPTLDETAGRALEVHIGIASGQVVASGGAGHRTYTVTGDTVNLASRLTDAADTGTILVSETVRHLLGDRLECAPVGALEIKGIATPVNAYRLLELLPATSGAERPFVGRRAQLRQFDGMLQACLESGCGQTVFVRGEAGIGKTRLIEEFERRSKQLGFASHGSRVLDFGAGIGQDAVRAIVRRLLGLGGTANPAQAATAVERALRDRRVSPGRRAHLNDLLDLPQPGELRALYDAMDNATRTRGRRETVAELIERKSASEPLLLFVEDVHWADLPTMEQLAEITRTVARCPAVLVITSRIEGDPLDATWLTGVVGSPLVTIDLGPLRDQEARALAKTYLETNSDFARSCVQRAAGNPLFLEQLLRHAEDHAEGGVPGSVQSLVQARLDQLAAADKQALQAASVLGQRFALATLRHLIDAPAYDCAGLVARFLLRPAGEELLFAHALIRDAVYDSLLMARRKELHGRAATRFAEGDLALRAEHLDRAGDPGAPEAYLAAAQSEIGHYRYERALTLAQRGLELAQRPEDRAALTFLSGDVLHDLGSMTGALQAYQAALDGAGDGVARCRAWLGLAAVKRVIEDLDGAFADLGRAEAAARRLGLNEQLARIHFLRGNLHFPRGNVQGVLEEHGKSLGFAEAAGSAELEAAALGGLGDAEYARGRMLTARRHFERCIELCRRHGFGRIEVASLPMAAITRFYAGELAGAYVDALAAVAAAERVGHHRAVIIACHIVFFCATARGEPEVARRHLDRALALSRQLEARRFEAECLWFLGEIRRAEGRRAEAIALVREALEISRVTGMSYIGPAILGGLARVSDDPKERRSALAEAEQLLAVGSISHNYLWFYHDAIETALEHHDWDEAEGYAQRLADYTRAESLPWTDLLVARGRTLAAFGAGRRGPQTIRELRQVHESAALIGWLATLPTLTAALASVSVVPEV